MAVAQTAELGGAEYALLRIARRLPERGFEVELTVPRPGPVEDAAAAAGLPVHRVAVGSIAVGAWPRAVIAYPRARRLLRRSRPDLVYLNGTVAQRLAPAFAGATLVPHLHDMLEWTPRPWRSERFWRSVPVVLCDSQAVAEAAVAVGAPEDRLRTVHCPIEPVEPAPRPDWAEAGPVIGFVGRLEPRKGALDLLRAAPAVLERVAEARFVIAGGEELEGSTEYVRRVREQAAELGDRVLLLGQVQEAARLMPWFDVLAVPSLREPFGTVAAEALSTGTPAVVTDSGGMPEYVEDGVCGAVVPPGEPAALAAALVDVVRHAGDMADAARAAAAPFASDRVADAVADALREALGAPAPLAAAGR
jgi:glycosyltransferase involved in cell wall biosynthesis